MRLVNQNDGISEVFVYVDIGLTPRVSHSVPVLLAVLFASFGVLTGMTDSSETERPSWPSAINATEAITKHKLTGDGSRIAILSEVIDISHPDLSQSVDAQYNSILVYGKMLAGRNGEAVTRDYISRDDWHGTHIAGTISSNCDGKGLKGLACNSKISVYDLGAYGGSSFLPLKGWPKQDSETQFLKAMIAAINHITGRNSEKILNSSFNLEAPYIAIDGDSPFWNQPVSQLVEAAVSESGDVTGFIDNQNFKLMHIKDKEYLERISIEHDDPTALTIGAIIPMSAEWHSLTSAIGKFQAAGGVYVIAESNNRFEDRSSVLNAMPLISEEVEAELWISVAMVQPHIDETTSYNSPLNSCGKLMALHCIVTPSYDILSTALYGNDLTPDEAIMIDGMPFVKKSGHSMGVPLVAATLALMTELNDREKLGLEMREIVAIIKNSANREFVGYNPDSHGVGMLDVENAIAQMLSDRRTSR